MKLESFSNFTFLLGKISSQLEICLRSWKDCLAVGNMASQLEICHCQLERCHCQLEICHCHLERWIFSWKYYGQMIKLYKGLQIYISFIGYSESEESLYFNLS